MCESTTQRADRPINLQYIAIKKTFDHNRENDTYFCMPYISTQKYTSGRVRPFKKSLVNVVSFLFNELLSTTFDT